MWRRNMPCARLSDMSPHLRCVLCGGYYIDATTIIECLHSFCKTCIVRYLETSKYCPICDVQVHKTRPLLNIRADKTLQDLVYKLVPGLFTSEMKQRQDFYHSHPEALTAGNQPDVQAEKRLYAHDQNISLVLQFSPDGKIVRGRPSRKRSSRRLSDLPGDTLPGLEKRYLQCPANFTIGHVKKFVRMKFNLSNLYLVDVFCYRDVLNENYALLDVAYIYSWNGKKPLRLFYSIFEDPKAAKKRRMDTREICEKAAKEVSNSSAPPANINVGSVSQKSAGNNKPGNASGSNTNMKHKAPVSLASSTCRSGPTAPKQAKTTNSTSTATPLTSSKATPSKVNNTTNTIVAKGLAGLAQKFGPGTSKLPSPKGTPTKSNVTLNKNNGNGKKVSPSVTNGETRVHNTKPGVVRPMSSGAGAGMVSGAGVKPPQNARATSTPTAGKAGPHKPVTVLEVPRTMFQMSAAAEKLRPSPALARQAQGIPYPIPGPIHTTDTIFSQQARLQGQVPAGHRINLVTPTSRTLTTAGPPRPMNTAIRPLNSIVRTNTTIVNTAVNALVRPQTTTKQTVMAKTTSTKPLALKPLTFKPKPAASIAGASTSVTSPVRQDGSGLRSPTTPGGTHGGLPQMVPHPAHVTEKSPVAPRHSADSTPSTEQGRQKPANSSGEQDAPLDLHRPKTVSVS